MTDPIPEDVAALAPSARLVYIVLEDAVHDEPGLVERTGLCERSIRNASQPLKQEDLIRTVPYQSDKRKPIYYRPDRYDFIEAIQQFND